MTDQYLDWLLNLLGLALVLATFLPLWPWPFDYWPLGAIGGFMTFLWLAMVAMDFMERKTGNYWLTKLGALFLLAGLAALTSTHGQAS